MKNNKGHIRSKRKHIYVFMCFCLIVILIGFFYIQIINHNYYEKRSGDNAYHPLKTNPSRGIIKDRNGKTIVSNRSTFSVQIYPDDYRDSSFNKKLYQDVGATFISIIPSSWTLRKKLFYSFQACILFSQYIQTLNCFPIQNFLLH